MVATATLLFCSLLFALLCRKCAPNSILRIRPGGNAQTHLSQLQVAYQTHTQTLVQQLKILAQNSQVTTTLLSHADITDSTKNAESASEQSALQDLLERSTLSNHLSTLVLLQQSGGSIAHGGTTLTPSTSTLLRPLLNSSSQGHTTLSIEPLKQNISPTNTWFLVIAQPITSVGNNHPVQGILVAMQPIDGIFAQDLAQHATTQRFSVNNNRSSATPREPGNITRTQVWSTQYQICQTTAEVIITHNNSTIPSAQARTMISFCLSETTITQLTPSALVIATVEPLYTLTTHPLSQSLIIAGLRTCDLCTRPFYFHLCHQRHCDLPAPPLTGSDKNAGSGFPNSIHRGTTHQ